MAGVSEHYDNLLAPYYSWISGGAELKFEQNREFFQAHDIRPALSGRAVDLGAGSGFQSIPLSKAGFEVIAIDGCRDLLMELKSYAKGMSIAAIEDDLLNFTAHIPGKVELIVCMGDTLTHLKTPVFGKQRPFNFGVQGSNPRIEKTGPVHPGAERSR